MTEVVLETRGLTYQYPGGVQALDGVDLAFRRGQRHVVLGANGAGKSTLFMLLNGVLRPSRGQVLLEAEPLDYGRRGLKNVRSKVGILFQDPDAQLLSASIREDISFGPMNLGLEVSEVQRRVDEALAAVHLEALADRPVHALSYGQKRRVGLAGLLAMHPQVLILDEPTAGLDHGSRLEVMALLDELCVQGMTVVLSTHSIDLAYAWADHAFVLSEGRLVASCGSEAFHEAFPAFESLGLGLPQVLRLHRHLVTAGMIAAVGPIPRDMDSLCRVVGTQACQVSLDT